jgi:replicative DNA helicase
MSHVTAEPTLHDEFAERAILGVILLRNDAFDSLDGLQPEHFGRLHHRQVFAAMQALHRRNERLDPIAVNDQLRQAGVLDGVGQAFVYAVVDGLPATTNLDTYVRVVRDKALARQLRDTGRALIAAANAGDTPAAEQLEAAEAAIYGLGVTTTTADWVNGETMASELFAAVETIATTKGGLTGVATGFADLDRMTRGLQRQELSILGARPSVGKTSLALQVALRHASKTDQDSITAMFSLEMGRQPIGMRALAVAGRVDSFRLLSGYLGEDDYTRVAAGLEAISASRLYLDDTAVLSPVQVRSKLRRLQAKTGKALGLVVIDYLQLMATLPETRRESRTVQLGGVSRMLKQLAREFNVPFLVLSQLNRETERSGNRRPQLSDLRESGAIEQDADLVLLLHRPEDGGVPSDLIEVIVAKQRNGPTGLVKLRFIKQQTRFEDA